MQRCRVTYCTLRYVLYITLNLAVCVGLWTVGFCGILVFWYCGYGGMVVYPPVGLRRYGAVKYILAREAVGPRSLAPSSLLALWASQKYLLAGGQGGIGLASLIGP